MALEGKDRALLMHLIRSMIVRVVLRPKVAGTGLDLELYGKLANFRAACAGVRIQNPPRISATGRFSLVAGTRNHLYRTTLLGD